MNKVIVYNFQQTENFSYFNVTKLPNKDVKISISGCSVKVPHKSTFVAKAFEKCSIKEH